MHIHDVIPQIEIAGERRKSGFAGVDVIARTDQVEVQQAGQRERRVVVVEREPAGVDADVVAVGVTAATTTSIATAESTIAKPATAAAVGVATTATATSAESTCATTTTTATVGVAAATTTTETYSAAAGKW